MTDEQFVLLIDTLESNDVSLVVDKINELVALLTSLNNIFNFIMFGLLIIVFLLAFNLGLKLMR